jgi:riboflavin biosynthesis pyrimidine reductase
MKADSARDLGIGGPGIAGSALAAGLVDEIDLYLNPIVVGGGTPSLPDGVRCRMELLDEHRFGSGVVYLQYRLGA